MDQKQIDLHFEELDSLILPATNSWVIYTPFVVQVATFAIIGLT